MNGLYSRPICYQRLYQIVSFYSSYYPKVRGLESGLGPQLLPSYSPQSTLVESFWTERSFPVTIATVGQESKVSLWNYISHHAPRPQGARPSLRPETPADPRDPGGVQDEELSAGERLRSRPTAEVPAPYNLAASRPRPALGTYTSGLIWPLVLGPVGCAEAGLRSGARDCSRHSSRA